MIHQKLVLHLVYCVDYCLLVFISFQFWRHAKATSNKKI